MELGVTRLRQDYGAARKSEVMKHKYLRLDCIQKKAAWDLDLQAAFLFFEVSISTF
ncbi:MAG: hypothetical protein JRD00_09295 [Deltaproteobacteria bacterium]|nr:hypothetical protein [Deltaproteobacteria bacterium]